MKTIGFIDYYLDEWHANNYPAWIDECGTEYKLAYAWAQIDSPNGGLTTEEWCERFGVTRCTSIEELCERSDRVIILAPSDPGKHLEYAERVFACGKSPYIDKTFTETYIEAKKIFELAKKHGVSFFSSSALRYADEIRPYESDMKKAVVKGGGGTIEEYIIHQIEMAVKCLGTGASAVTYIPGASDEKVSVDYPDGRCAALTFECGAAFSITLTDGEGVNHAHTITSSFFSSLIADILRFFDSGVTSFDTAQTLEVMKIREAVIKGKKTPGEKIVI